MKVMKDEEAEAAIGEQVRTTYVTRSGNPRPDEHQFEGTLVRVAKQGGRLQGMLRYACSETESGYSSMWVPIAFLEVTR